MLSEIEASRLRVSRTTAAEKKSHFGQFLTPAMTAQFMAGLFGQPSPGAICNLLDAGAGIGSLSVAFLDVCLSGRFCFGRIGVTAYEIDDGLRQELSANLAKYSPRLPVTCEVHGGDFIEAAVASIERGTRCYTHAILNPPYRKLNGASAHRRLQSQVGIETPNLYSAFVALALSLMARQGQLVAIIPRSFCNGPYYRAFRNFILDRAALRRIHLFVSRSSAFKDDDVLQENVIIHLERYGQQGDVTVSTSTDDTFADLETHTYPFHRIVRPEDPQRFIHVPDSSDPATIEQAASVRSSLDGIGVVVSTGPVVDFRMAEHLRQMPEPGTVPLLYPGHFRRWRCEWPQPDLGKSNAILRNADTEKWLYPSGFYCVVRRFSSKEERRRIVASVVEPRAFGQAEALGFENHLNVFHDGRHGLPDELAWGLALFLNTTAVDKHFRSFSGHTQVNATDLRGMKYPSREVLSALGKWAMDQGGEPTQEAVDSHLGGLMA